MSRLTDLIAQVKAKDPDLGRELEREFNTLLSRRSFGLKFERHGPESVELPARPVRKGDKVRILSPRGSTEKGDQRLWRICGFEHQDGKRVARAKPIGSIDAEQRLVAVEDLVVVAEFRDYLYPGLVGTGKVERGGNKPYHTVISTPKALFDTTNFRVQMSHLQNSASLARSHDFHTPGQNRRDLYRPAVQLRGKGLEVQQ